MPRRSSKTYSRRSAATRAGTNVAARRAGWVLMLSAHRILLELAEHRRVVSAIGAGVEPASIPADLKAKTLTRATGRRAAATEPSRGRPRRTWLQAAAVLLIGLLGTYVASLRSTVNTLTQELAVSSEGAPAPISAGLLAVDASGAAQLSIDLPPDVPSVGTLAVTIEPGPSGSPGPTTEPLPAGTGTAGG